MCKSKPYLDPIKPSYFRAMVSVYNSLKNSGDPVQETTATSEIAAAFLTLLRVRLCIAAVLTSI